ncbi:MAG: sterol desaturase family protein [Ignavibacteriota bacterium]|nr:sterol desaturase family protein [Ignavibacteriota bacterium]MBW7841447.1 sterol desaturase family protein [Ignavibacterium sp.]MCO6447897.1 sterol desaturase family protein [Ignavibacterium album]MCZ2267738.1 sterol desaturase family protein [Ignavibacteriales bacterium]HMN16138.1 sterol desaturase family protein [Ignavibacteriaceae bacterium]
MQANIISELIDTISGYFLNMSNAEKYSMLIIFAAAILFVILERIFPYTKGQKVLREGFFDDLALYTIAQSYILSIIIFSFIISYIDETTGLSRLKLFADVPVWIQLIFFTITHDIYIYFMHRWQHSNKWLWRIHEAHHSPKKVDWLSGSRSHALEILINQTIEFAPIILLGSPPEVIAYKGLISAVWGMYIHSNLNVKTGWLQKIINGPEMHRWHHSTGKGRNRNFATKFAIWDWVFGTAYLPETKPDEYGLKTYFPAHYFNQTLYAFRRFKKKQ